MTERVARLRQCSQAAKPWLTLERAALLTEFYRDAGPLSPPLLRAGALAYIMEHRTLYIGPEELIVGERGPRPKSAPTYPEICCHTPADFEILIGHAEREIDGSYDVHPAGGHFGFAFREARLRQSEDA